MVSSDGLRTTFEVGEPVRVGEMQHVTILGRTELLRSSDQSVSKTYEYKQSSQVGASVLINSVVFGYDSEYCPRDGAFFATIDEYSVAKSAGLNVCGQLGHSNFADTVTPEVFSLPPGKKASRIFTNFLSIGINLFVLTEDGEVYGSGNNQSGQLGAGFVGSSTNPSAIGVSLPVKFNLPAGDSTAVFVAPLGYATFVVTSKGNAYAAGHNVSGVAGIGSSNESLLLSTPVKITLPAGEKFQANTKAWALDRLTVYAISESGKVYGWGESNNGQLARNDTKDQPSPVELSLSASEGAAKQVVFDGETVYIRTEAGNVFSAGNTSFGQTGNRYVRIRSGANDSDKCLASSGSSSIIAAKCDEGSSRQLWYFSAAGALRNQYTNTCIDNWDAGDGAAALYTCQGNYDQRFRPSYVCYSVGACDGYWTRIMNANPDAGNPTPAYCLYVQSNSIVKMKTCDNSDEQQFSLYDVVLRPIPLPTGEKVVDVSTDQYFATMVMDSGAVYTWGLNNGAFGAGVSVIDGSSVDSHLKWNPDLVRYGSFGMAGQPRAVSSWTSSYGWAAVNSNIFVVTNNGTVFGTGSNYYGQLGIGTTSLNSVSTPQQMTVIGEIGNAAKEVRSGYGTTVIYTNNGKVFTVGNNSNGQLGDGTLQNNSIPKTNVRTNVRDVQLIY